MLDYDSVRLRASPWVCFVLGGILLVWALLDKKGAVTFDDLYPAVAAIAAGLLLLGFLKYVDRGANEDSSPAQGPAPGSSQDA